MDTDVPGTSTSGEDTAPDTGPTLPVVTDQQTSPVMTNPDTLPDVTLPGGTTPGGTIGESTILVVDTTTGTNESLLDLCADYPYLPWCPGSDTIDRLPPEFRAWVIEHGNEITANNTQMPVDELRRFIVEARVQGQDDYAALLEDALEQLGEHPGS